MAANTIDISKTYTLDEYIRIEETSTEKHEFYYGKLIAMPGESLLHNKICLRLYTLLANLLLKNGFEIFVESVKVNVEAGQVYVYPDIVVMKEQPQGNLPYKDYIVYNPLLIIEVLSDSTRKYDLTDKFIHYQKVASLQYYLAVDPVKHAVLYYEKDASNEWSSKIFTGDDEIINLPCLNAAITLGDIYNNR